MTDVLLLIQAWLSNSWLMLTSVNVPGLGVSFAALFVGLFLAVFSLKILGLMMGVSISSSDFYRAGSGGRAHLVSSKRKGDEK